MEAEVIDTNEMTTRVKYTIKVSTNELSPDTLIKNRAKAKALVAYGIVNTMEDAIQVVKAMAGRDFMQATGPQKIGDIDGIRGKFGGNEYKVDVIIEDQEGKGIDFDSLGEYTSSLKEKSPGDIIGDDDEDEDESGSSSGEKKVLRGGAGKGFVDEMREQVWGDDED